jgi:hypothetical protein
VLENHKEVITQLCTKCGIEISNNEEEEQKDENND